MPENLHVIWVNQWFAPSMAKWLFKMPTCDEGDYHVGLAGFSDIQIEQHWGGRVADNAIVQQASLAGVASVANANPVKPDTVVVTQAAQLAVVHRRDGGFWWDLTGHRPRQTREPHERVSASGCTAAHINAHSYHQINRQTIPSDLTCTWKLIEKCQFILAHKAKYEARVFSINQSII